MAQRIRNIQQYNAIAKNSANLLFIKVIRTLCTICSVRMPCACRPTKLFTCNIFYGFVKFQFALKLNGHVQCTGHYKVYMTPADYKKIEVLRKTCFNVAALRTFIITFSSCSTYFLDMRNKFQEISFSSYKACFMQ